MDSCFSFNYGQLLSVDRANIRNFLICWIFFPFSHSLKITHSNSKDVVVKCFINSIGDLPDPGALLFFMFCNAVLISFILRVSTSFATVYTISNSVYKYSLLCSLSRLSKESCYFSIVYCFS